MPEKQSNQRETVELWLSAVLVFSIMSCYADAGPCSVSPSLYWKNTIDYPLDDFRNGDQFNPDPGWVKFTILTCDPTTVYFQDSNAYVFHYNFANEVLDPFLGISPSAFDDATLFEEGQQAVLGAVVMPPLWGFPAPPDFPEYGIQFVRRDAYTPQEIVDLFNLVKSKINADPGVQAFYFPTFEQLEVAQDNIAFFESNGIPVSSTARWLTGNTCYSNGWALGTINFVAGDEIEAAYLAGTLKPEDILLTDGVPAEVPFVAGIMTLAPSTPNSHVAILANTFQVPFVHLADADIAQRAQDLLGRLVVLRAFPQSLFGAIGESCDVRIIDVEDELSAQQIQEILALKEPAELNISPMARYGAYSESVEGLLPPDIQFFGGKAANFGFLRTAIPNESPVATAFSFDLWNEFLDQTLASGNTLREEIDLRLAPYTYPPNFAALAAVLDAIREMFKDEAVTVFSPQLQSAVIATLQNPQYGFDPNIKIRFRSSTNVEDSDQFTGAGLYDSKSGCLADDLDADEDGPSHCDPSDADERGVFRAIRRVFDSFYHDNAYLERLRHGVDEHTVGMAVLTHHSFPDEIELANGVATLHYKPPFSTEMTLVTQDGAVSVSNPEGGAIPEVVDVVVSPGGQFTLGFVSPSNLVQLGAQVMDWPDEYSTMAQLLFDVAEAYAAYSGLSDFFLDYEYKKMAPGGGVLPAGGLVVKQVRRIPQPDNTPTITPFLVNDPQEYEVLQGSARSVFANHRLKMRATFETENLWLTPENLASQSIFGTISASYYDGCSVVPLSGPVSGLPGAFHAYDDANTTTDGWQFDQLLNPRSYELVTTNVGLLVSAAQSPILTLRDLGSSALGYLDIHVTYDTAVPFTPIFGDPELVTEDAIALAPVEPPPGGEQFHERSFSFDSGVSIDTSFWLAVPNSICAGCIFPVARWEETVITGLTSEPIVLRDYFSQSYDAGQHNFTEHFLFEPRAEPGISPLIVQELEDQGIRFIHMTVMFGAASDPVYYGDEMVGHACASTSAIPAVSTWGLVVFLLLLLTCGTILYRSHEPLAV